MSKYGSRTDESWAVLRRAMPSFADRWCAYTEAPGYNPLEVDQNFLEFEFHLGDVVASDVDSLAPLFAAMEHLYARADDSEREKLTIGILETLAQDAEEHGVDLRRIARLFPGEMTRRQWRVALTWTHPECDWDDERGLVPHRPPPVPVGRVRVIASHDLPDTPTFAVDVELVDGRIGAGLFMWKRLSSCHHEGRAIATVESLPSPPSSASSPVQLRALVAHHEDEPADQRWLIGEGWYDTDEIVEIIEQLPPRWN